MREFFGVLDKGGRFKNWLGAVAPDEDLVSAYVRDITSEPLIQGVKSKLLRYVLTTGIGCVAPVAGMVATFVDTFATEKLLGGWKPNHFVSKNLSPFVRGQ
ncbi:hypothetical protein [Burkholderia cepacia]|uniref:hypothetical protein n=1 Tax=Burkholderia cepacia TaxID=292 RepID=UPI0012D96BCC|nr:hypothetical protein [Burkholderia cepacia]